jgi:Transcriptional regulator PadR-like family
VPPSAWRSCPAITLASSLAAAIAEASEWRSRCGCAAIPASCAKTRNVRLACSGLLADRPMTGYDLTRTFERSLANVWPASHGQIYPELGRLSTAGLIRQAASGSRGKKIYEITPDGLAEIRQWLRSEPDH